MKMVNRGIELRLLGLNEIDLTDGSFNDFRGVPLSKIENKTVVDFWLHVDGLRPTLSGDAGSETLGLPDMLVAHRTFSFTTEHFFNEHYDIVDGAILLEKWLYCPYKFFTIWKYNPADYLYYLTHNFRFPLPPFPLCSRHRWCLLLRQNLCSW